MKKILVYTIGMIILMTGCSAFAQQPVYSCDILEAVSADDWACAECDGTDYPRYWEDGWCYSCIERMNTRECCDKMDGNLQCPYDDYWDDDDNDNEENCVCAIENEKVACNYENCIKCDSYAGTPECPYYMGECLCVPEGDSWDCRDYACISCPSGNARGPYLSGDCICAPEGYSSACSEETCKICSPEEGTAQCSYWGECLCVPEGYSSACGEGKCKSCSPEEGTAICPYYYGDCLCVPEGYTSECNNDTC